MKKKQSVAEMNNYLNWAAALRLPGDLIGRVFEFRFDSAGNLQIERELSARTQRNNKNRFKFLSRVYLTKRLPLSKSPCTQLLRKELGA